MTALDNVALTANRAALVNNLIAIADNPTLPVESRNAAIETLNPADIEQRTEVEAVENRAAVQAEQRSAIAANPVGVPSGDRQVRAGDLLAAEARAISGAAGMGAAFTPAENANFAVDFLAKTSVLFASGVNVLRTTGDSIVVPHMLSDGIATPVAEGQPLPISDPNGESLTAVIRKWAQQTTINNEVIADAKPSVLDQAAKSLLRSVALGYDKSAFEGTGTAPDIRGLKNVAGIGTFPITANGSAITNLDAIADALALLDAANADSDSAVIVMPPRTWSAITKIKQATGSNLSVVQDASGSASGGVERRLFGRRVFTSANLTLTEAEGTSGNVCNSIYVYVPSEVWAVVREDTLYTVNPWALGASDQTLVTAKFRGDLLVPNPSAVVRITGVK
ncbi:phage major capsid protein [Micromonospora sp. NPDC005710]|uniref:phage major capsid protein n=1 Tax=Micromonospora sp. NPDC005710 TaxID=3157051 RepID=UPI003405DE5E